MARKASRKASRKAARKASKAPGQQMAKSAPAKKPAEAEEGVQPGGLKKKFYEAELERLQVELVKLQYWVKQEGLRVVAIFEGRDAAGKGGVIKRMTEPLNPRGARVVALSKPSDTEASQWYFQRYVAHLPSAGEMVFFDRSWYNRAGVERVMGFCTDSQYREFLRSCPEYERMLVRSGITLLKFWFSVSEEEQEKRFQARAKDVTKRWKLSPMDMKSRNMWDEYSRAKDEMFFYTDIPEAPWITIESDDKRAARLNCLQAILDRIPHKDTAPKKIQLPPRVHSEHIERPPRDGQIILREYKPRA